METYFSQVIPKSIAIGVSGGADSLALTYLFTQWKLLRFPEIQLFPFIVDHGIRKESYRECLQVAGWLETWGLIPRILDCKGSGSNQAQWRKVRYEVLLLACHTHHVSLLTLAHHQDDVLETVWMRKQTLSDWRGQAGISSHRIQWDIHILRPLLAWPKRTMYRLLEYINQPWIEDPSNRSSRFYRGKVRCFLETQSREERQIFWRKTLILAEQRYKESVAFTYQVQDMPVLGGYAFLWSSECFELPISQGAWILSQWILSIMYNDSPIKRAALHTAWKNVLSSKHCPGPPRIIFTLGGCVGIRTQDRLYCFREWGRIIPQQAPSAQTLWMWDKRVLFSPSRPILVSAAGYKPNYGYKSFMPIPYDMPKYVARQAEAAMPSAPGGKLCYPSVPCPIFTLPLGIFAN